MSQNNWPFIINVGNSIIGVTVLAMPFCFQACGIILGTLLLLFATWLTIVSCQLLMKAGVTSRRRSYSLLAMFTHGALGKLIVEVGMIGLQLGTLIAQVVIIGDLGPAILSKATGLPNSDNLRTGLIVFLCLFIGLPLGLLKDVRTLSKTSSLCMAFYAFFTAYVVVLSIPKLISGDWYNQVNFWRMEGFFQCLPIFSFAFGCQTQLFIVYDALSEPSLKRINSIVNSAVNVCTVSYLLVGFFGYVAFCNAGELSGDIINHFKQDSACDVIKLLFVFSIAVTIPLIMFPCRASLYTLCFSHKHRDDVPGGGKIPEMHFKVITVVIIIGSMITGILIPNIEFVLGINGATMGTLICYIFPALFFLSVMSEKAEGLLTSKVVLALGITIMVASTYTILATESTEVRVDTTDMGESNPVIDPAKIDQSKQLIDGLRGEMAAANKSKMEEKQVNTQERHEPPIPQAPDDHVHENKEVEVKLVKKSDNDLRDQIDKNKQALEQQNEKQGESVDKTGDKDRVMPKEDEIVQDKKEEKLKEAEKKQNEILAKLEQQQEQQEKLIQEQKEILEQLKEHKDSHKEDESALNQGQKNLPNDLNQNQILQNDQGLQLAADVDHGEQMKPVDIQVPLQKDVHVPQHNQREVGQILQHDQQGGGQILNQNQQGGGQIPQQGQQGGQIFQQNQQGGGQIPQQGQQGGQIFQQNQLGGGQVPQQGQQGGGQVPQQIQQGGGQIPQQGGGQGDVQPPKQNQQLFMDDQLHLHKNKQVLNLGEQLQLLPDVQHAAKQDDVQMHPDAAMQNNQQVNAKKPLNNHNNEFVDKMQQLAVDNLHIGVHDELEHRNKRDAGPMVNNEVNVPNAGQVLNKAVNAESEANKNEFQESVVDKSDKKMITGEIDRTNKEGENDGVDKETNGQRELKQLKTDVGKAQYGDDRYINEVLSGMKEKIENNVESIGKGVKNKIGIYMKSRRKL